MTALKKLPQLIDHDNCFEGDFSPIQLIDSTPACIKVITEEGELLSMNQTGLELIEVESAEMAIGQNVINIVMPEFREAFMEMNRRVCQGESRSLEFKIQGFKGTERWMQTFAVPFPSKDGKIHHLAVTHDISKRKKLEEELLTQKKNLVHSGRMAALGEMSAGIAHEINNPLTVIMAKARKIEMMLDRDKLTKESGAKDLEIIRGTVNRIYKIVKGLKVFSRNSEDDELETIPLSQILEDTLAFCEEKIKNHGFHFEVENLENPILNCRPVEISQVILNLLNNAFDANTDNPEKWIRVIITRENGEACIEISDSGHGIPPEIQTKILEPFFTTKEVGKGTGLGLSISSGIIEKHGGRLVYDDKGPNTCFKVFLPLQS